MNGEKERDMAPRGRRRRPSPFYASRRVPHAITNAHARLRMAPLLPAVSLAACATLIAESPLLPSALRPTFSERAGRIGSHVSQKSQQVFFDDPGLDTLLIRLISRLGGRVSSLARTWLRLTIAVGADRDGRARIMLPLVPSGDYDSVMTWMLVAGTSVGLLRGGAVHTRLIVDSGPVPAHKTTGKGGSRLGAATATLPWPRPHETDSFPRWTQPPLGHPTPQFRRIGAPMTLSDLAADVDDLYWAGSYGQCVKIIRVGTQDKRRWVIILPGTDHIDFASTVNPADTETNIRESLGLASAMRVGVVEAAHQAMALEGLSPTEWASEPVLICGHSQGGMIAVGLAANSPDDVGLNVQAILAMGSPGRRFKIRPDVTMIAVEHDQDVIPSFDGAPARAPDHRVVVGRRLVRPRRDPLYYAHSSSTYTETVTQLERKVAVTPWGRLASTVTALRDFLPTEGEQTRVTFHDVWQEIVEPTTADTWDVFIDLDRQTPTHTAQTPRVTRTTQGGNGGPADQ